MWEKVKFIMSDLGAKLWPFIKSLLKAESQIVMDSAKAALIRLRDDAAFQKLPWQEKLATTVGMVLADLATKGIQVSITMIINAIQAEYAALKDK